MNSIDGAREANMESAMRGGFGRVASLVVENEQLRQQLTSLRAQHAELEMLRGFADLWYFAMDDAPGEFERIVTTYSPAAWMSEIAKVRATTKREK